MNCQYFFGGLIVLTFILFLILKSATDHKYTLINSMPMVPNCNLLDERSCRDLPPPPEHCGRLTA